MVGFGINGEIGGGDLFLETLFCIKRIHLVVDLRPMRLTTGRTYDHKKNK
jgi:hypothetical protein